MNPFLIAILAILVARYLLDACAAVLNVRHQEDQPPDEFHERCDLEKFRTSQRYLITNTRFGMLTETVSTALVIGFILTGGFNWIDGIARGFSDHAIIAGLIFTGLLLLLSKAVSLPFDLYDTYVIEERFGFNRTRPATYVADLAKTLVLTALIGGPILAGVIWFFTAFGSWAWLYVWGGLILVQLLMMVIAPVLIMPLFNTFTPLEAGELRSAIETYAAREQFAIKGIYTMDGSRRSGKSNAFFTGIGKSRRIVLFDTLIEKHTTEELLAIVAHEMGHYKHRHIPKAILRAIAHTGLSLYLLSICLEAPGLYTAFGMQHQSVYAGLVFFGFLYTPIAFILGILENAISRKHEYEADAYAARTTGTPKHLVSGLKRLSIDNLSNLTPHPLTVFLGYSHPPVSQRIRALQQIDAATAAA